MHKLIIAMSFLFCYCRISFFSRIVKLILDSLLYGRSLCIISLLLNKKPSLTELELLLLKVKLSSSKLKLLSLDSVLVIIEIFAVVELLLLVSGRAESIAVILAAILIKDYVKLLYL